MQAKELKSSDRPLAAEPTRTGELPFHDLKTQYRALKDSIDSRIRRVLEHGQYIMGPEVKELEDKLAAFAGVGHCVGVANGTDALLIAMMALGIERGDEVITTPFTFVANAEMIALLGARPVFVDIDRHTYNLDPQLLEAAITPHTRAIMPVALYGQCADMDLIGEVAGRYRLPVIDDAAQSFGATYKGRRSGAFGTISCTSFFPSKPLGCYGDGGACFTNDDNLAARMRQIRVHGQDKRYHHALIGLNGRLDTIQAAILLAKFDVFPDEIAARARVASRYDHALRGHVRTPVIRGDCTSVYAQYTIEVNDRDSFVSSLKQEGIPTAIHYPIPLNLQPAFAYLGQGPRSFPNAETAAQGVVSLPMHPYLTLAEQDCVIQTVLSAVDPRRSPSHAARG
ncbi:MAG: DegT/DnrJ/EryC1/StrS family aminotransferase [Pseudomonadota bacterium]